MKGISLIAGVIFIAITITATFIVYQATIPVVQNLQATAAVEKMTDTMARFDKAILEVASEGKGSKRTFTLNPEPGTLYINEEDDTIYWELPTNAPIISPRTSQAFGNLRIGANLDVNLSEENYTLATPEIPSYVIENNRLKVFIRKVGLPTSFASISTSDIVLAIYNKDHQTWLNNPRFLDLSLDDDGDSKTGNGYTTAQTGSLLPSGKVTAYFNTSYLAYYVDFSLDSGADFLRIEGRLE